MIKISVPDAAHNRRKRESPVLPCRQRLVFSCLFREKGLLDKLRKTLTVFLRYRYLLYNLISRDIKVKYRRSVLGIVWSILNPLLMMLVMTAVFSRVFKFNVPNFPVYYLLGSTIWNFFSEATNTATTSVLASSSLIKKVYIPKYMFPLEKVMFSFVNMLFSLIAVAFIFLVTGTPLTWTALLIPLPLLYVLVFALGVSMALSALTVYFRDVLHLYAVVLTAWMYFTPIFYPVNALPEIMQNVLKINPMYHYVTYFRDILMYNTIPSLGTNLICIGWGIVSLLVGLAIFKKLQGNFILYI